MRMRQDSPPWRAVRRPRGDEAAWPASAVGFVTACRRWSEAAADQEVERMYEPAQPNATLTQVPSRPGGMDVDSVRDSFTRHLRARDPLQLRR